MYASEPVQFNSAAPSCGGGAWGSSALARPEAVGARSSPRRAGPPGSVGVGLEFFVDARPSRPVATVEVLRKPSVGELGMEGSLGQCRGFQTWGALRIQVSFSSVSRRKRARSAWLIRISSRGGGTPLRPGPEAPMLVLGEVAAASLLVPSRPSEPCGRRGCVWPSIDPIVQARVRCKGLISRQGRDLWTRGMTWAQL